MIQSHKKKMILVGCLAALAGALSSCNDDDNAAAAPPPLNAEALGGVNFNCGDGSQQQQQSTQQVPFQKDPACTPAQNTPAQKFEFQQSKLADFDIRLDCEDRQVVIQTRGRDSRTQTLPIAFDDTVNGQIEMVNQVADDGKGTGACWVGYLITFSGKANCSGSIVTTAADESPMASPSPSASAMAPGQSSLQLTASVDFQPTTADELSSLGIDVSGQQPGATPSPSPSITGSPAPSPTTSMSPSPSPSPTTSMSPSPSPTVSVTPVKFCTVDNACPLIGDSTLSCPASTSTP
jgi:hypothetical protein